MRLAPLAFSMGSDRDPTAGLSAAPTTCLGEMDQDPAWGDQVLKEGPDGGDPVDGGAAGASRCGRLMD